MDRADTYPFLEPVTVLWPDLEDYVHVIKKPMDLGTVRQKMEKGRYKDNKSRLFNHHKFIADVQLVFQNCCTYNIETSELYRAAENLERDFLRGMKALPDKVPSKKNRGEHEKIETRGGARDADERNEGNLKTEEVDVPEEKNMKTIDEEAKRERADNNEENSKIANVGFEKQSTADGKIENPKQPVDEKKTADKDKVEPGRAHNDKAIEQDEEISKGNSDGEKNDPADANQKEEVIDEDGLENRDEKQKESPDDAKGTKKRKRENTERRRVKAKKEDTEVDSSNNSSKEETAKQDKIEEYKNQVIALRKMLDQLEQQAKSLRQEDMSRDEVVKLRDTVENLPWNLTTEVVKLMSDFGYLKKDAMEESGPEFVNIELASVKDECLRAIEDIVRPSTTRIFVLDKITKTENEIEDAEIEIHKLHNASKLQKEKKKNSV